jgi:hypothetical protein
MRRVWYGLALAAGLFGAGGCASRNQLKPPTPPEVYAVPPSDDRRFAGPPQYPAGTLNQDAIHKNAQVDSAGAFRAGGGGRMGGGGNNIAGGSY